MKVLLADDAPDVRLILRVLLSHEKDFEIAGEAATPDETLRLCELDPPDVVVMDMNFGTAVTGAELSVQLKQRFSDIKVILFTAFDVVPDEVSNSVDAVVLKTDLQTLPNVIRRLPT